MKFLFEIFFTYSVFFFHSYHQILNTYLQLRQRVYKGIPNAVRGEVWTRLLGVPQIKIEQEGKYEVWIQKTFLLLIFY